MPGIKDLRKELRELRSVAPVSKMKKGEVLAELERLRGPAVPAVTIPSRRRIPEDFDFGSDSEDDFAFVPQVAPKAKAVAAPKVKAAPKAAAVAPAKAVAQKAKLIKGSEEAKAHMARLRELRKR